MSVKRKAPYKDVDRVGTALPLTSETSTSSQSVVAMRVQPFVLKLFNMLSEDCDKNDKIVSWCDDDDASFIIKNSQMFSQTVLNLYFDCNLQSFKRQLNYYGFVRVAVTQQSKSKANKKFLRAIRYSHDQKKFKRNRRDLLHEIHRSTNNDPKIQTDYLREKVAYLEKENEKLKDQVSDLQNDVQELKEDFRSFLTRDNPSKLQRVPSTGLLRSSSSACAPWKRVESISSGLLPADERRAPSLGLIRLGSLGSVPATLGSYPLSRGNSLGTADDQEWEECRDWDGVKSLLASEGLVRMSSIPSKGKESNLPAKKFDKS